MFTRKRQVISAPPAAAEPTNDIGHEALGFLSRHGLQDSPANYAFAWLVKGDRKSLASIAVDAILMEGRRVTQNDVNQVMLAEARQSQRAADPASSHEEIIRHQTLRLADLAAEAVSDTSNFGRDLSAGLSELEHGNNSVELVVAAMVQRTREVEEQLTKASSEIEKLRQQVEASREDAQRDALTGLLNRRGVLHDMSGRPPSSSGIVALCDVDHFKSVNDRFGHGVGDRVLKGVAASLSESVGVHTVARWGGEEFLIVLEDIDTAAGAKILEQARRELEARSFKDRDTGEPIGTVTISIGATSLETGASDEAIEAADRLLYAAKNAGRNCLKFADDRRTS